jgi:hypothetical protein
MKQSRRQVPSIPIMETPIPFFKSYALAVAALGSGHVGCLGWPCKLPAKPQKNY